LRGLSWVICVFQPAQISTDGRGGKTERLNTNVKECDMGKRHPVMVNGTTFPTKAALLGHVRGILYRHAPGTPIGEPDRSFLLALLGRHASAGRKVGVGVAALTVELNAVFPGNRGFWLTRTDGTRTDWSFLECVSPSSRLAEFKAACRRAVAGQVIEFRQRAFAEAGGTVTCPVTGRRVGVADSHVDHAPPLTFERLLADFVAENGLDPEAVEVLQHGDGDIETRLVDQDLEARWCEYHRRRAVLRVTSREGNLTQGRSARFEHGETPRR
jgi:hypothetical protein